LSILKKQIIKGVMWSSIERFSVQGVQFVLGIILARILYPSDYGLIGMIAIFMSISMSLIDSGFSQALIQKKNATEKDYNTAFYFNIITAFLVYVILFFTAKPIAVFYGEPILESLTKVVGLNIIFSSLSIVQIAKLSKSLNFKLQTKASLISVIISGSIGIYLAYIDWGVWALCIQIVVKSGLNTIMLFVLSFWRPKIMFSKKSFNSLFSFGSKLLLSGLLNAVFDNIYLIVIGKFYNITELGYYTRANQLQLLPSETITVILQRVTFPVLSSIQDQKKKLEHYYIKFIRFAAFIIFPLMIGLAVIASPLIILVLTEKWKAAATFLQLLCFVGILYPIHAINLNILKVKGRSDLFLKLEVYKKILTTLTVLITFSFGVKALIIGQIVCSVFFLFLNTFYSKKLIDYSLFNQIKDILPILFVSALMGFIVFVSIYYIQSNLLKLSTALFLGPLSYYVLSYLFKFDEINELHKFASKLKRKI
jgi:O-antigen/teichoic acid export membrane protein